MFIARNHLDWIYDDTGENTGWRHTPQDCNQSNYNQRHEHISRKKWRKPAWVRVIFGEPTTAPAPSESQYDIWKSYTNLQNDKNQHFKKKNKNSPRTYYNYGWSSDCHLSFISLFISNLYISRSTKMKETIICFGMVCVKIFLLLQIWKTILPRLATTALVFFFWYSLRGFKSFLGDDLSHFISLPLVISFLSSHCATAVCLSQLGLLTVLHFSFFLGVKCWRSTVVYGGLGDTYI